MPIYKTGKTKDGKAQYRVFVNYIDADGKYRKLSRTVYGAAEAKIVKKNHWSTIVYKTTSWAFFLRSVCSDNYSVLFAQPPHINREFMNVLFYQNLSSKFLRT